MDIDASYLPDEEQRKGDIVKPCGNPKESRVVTTKFNIESWKALDDVLYPQYFHNLKNLDRHI